MVNASPTLTALANPSVVEAKYGDGTGGIEDSESDSEDETEDEDGFLATDALDAQISETLRAIRSKDPRIYDKDYTFIAQEDDEDEQTTSKVKKEKPLHLQDYHRERLLRGDQGDSDEEDAPQTYVQEQAALKRQLLNDIEATLAAEEQADDDEGDVFIKRKKVPKRDREDAKAQKAAAPVTITATDVENADKDPELYLSNFMAAKAWIPQDGSNWKPFDSDEEDDSLDEEADKWETMYNRRFEDPNQTNEVLTTYARDIAKQRSVRREKTNARQRQREQEKARKAAEKAARDDERNRLRRLKIEETQWRLERIREVAGANKKELRDDEWVKFLDDEWDNEKWEEEMKNTFGDDYYARAEEEGDANSEDDEGGKKNKKKKKPKKPKWDDDIDIKDIVPDFEDDEAADFSLSDAEDNAEGLQDGFEDNDEEDSGPAKRSKTSKDHKKDRAEKKKAAKQQRAKIEAFVDKKLSLESPNILTSVGGKRKRSAGSGAGAFAPFRYRATSPESFGMTARDILLAPSDAALNQYAGLKKFASFRDVDKKRRDRKRFGKGHHLRMWRKEVFGPRFEKTGPTYGFESLVDGGEGKVVDGARTGGAGAQDGAGEGEAAKKKRKRSKGKKIKSGGDDE